MKEKTDFHVHVLKSILSEYEFLRSMARVGADIYQIINERIHALKTETKPAEGGKV